MQFSAMTMNMYLPDYVDPADDHRIIEMTVEQSVWLAELGYNVWFTDHHFKGPWNSNIMQFAAFVLPRIPRERYVGFGVLSIPFYHPLRLIESMNLLDHLGEGRVLFGVGSGWQGTEPAGLGIDPEYHASGKAAEDTLDVMRRLWSFRDGDPEYTFSIGHYSGTVKRRVMPAPYTKPHPTVIRTATREPAIVRAAHLGLPAFLGVLGADLREQIRIYGAALAEANHPPEIEQNCLRWCSVDWLSLCVAETDEEAKAREKLAQAEQMAMRRQYIARYGRLDGPVMTQKAGKSTAEDYSKGLDMVGSIAGSPDTVAAKIQELVDLGIHHMHVRFIGEWTGETHQIVKDSAELFAREIIPRFPARDDNMGQGYVVS
jgi:alkanesulfonate monooxygenase SsuD/methylene tetrahydromethanopterin reductase-like flavin-dependent oxidoreductase (luciferase family)